MNKRFLVLALVLLLAVCAFAVTAAADEPALPTTCEHCKKEVTWTALDEAKLAEISAMSTPTLATGHYYLAFEGDSCDVASMTLAANKTVCIYMNGKTLNGTTRAFIVREATLNIMGEGTVLGHGTSATTLGGTIYGAAGSEINVYKTQLRFEQAANIKADNGGVLYIADACNLYDVTVSGGVAKTGGNCFVSEMGHLRISGGSIETGSATTGKSMYARGCVTLEKDASVAELYFSPKAGGPEIGDFLTIKGAYTGTMKLRTSSSYLVDGGDIGNSDDADLTGAKLSIYNSSLYIVVDGDDIKLSLTKPTLKRDAYCEHCKKTVQWTGLTDADSGAGYISTGHYYLAFSGASSAYGTKTIVGHDQICLDLNGKHLDATDRSFHVHTGVLNIMDSVGGGLVTGRGITGQTYGGSLFVRENGTLNIYGGKYSYKVADDGRDVVLRGGVIYTRGTVNLYDGEIYGGAAKIGGNVYVDIVKDSDTGLYHYGELNLFGGSIQDNAALSTGASTKGPCVFSKALVTLSGDANVEQIYFEVDANGPAQMEMLTVSDAYTGTTQLHFNSYKEGMDVGTNNNADLSGAHITVTNDTKAQILPYGDDLLVIGSDPAVILNDTAVTGTYDTLSAAIAAYDSSMGRIVLLSDCADAVTLTKDLYIDLNGYALTGKISGDKTLYCMDSRTDDYTVADGIYSRLPVAEGINIAGIPVEFEGAEDGYLMIEEDGMLSFHRVNLQIKSMTLRSENVGVYFNSDFAGDEMVKARVQKFGVALNATEEPAVSNFGTTSKLTSFSQEKFNTDAESTSSLLYGIMKPTNSESVNKEHASTVVYGRAYIQLGEDAYMLGQCQNRTLQEQVEATDGSFANMTTVQMKNILDLCDAYSGIVADWAIPTINTWITDLHDRTNGDYSPYLSPDSWPTDVAAQAIADGKIHYYFMSGEGMVLSPNGSQKDRWGDACLIVFPNGENMLVDTGPALYGPVLTRNLLRMGVTKIDYLVITHPHSDHVNGAFHKLNVLDENGFLNNIQVEQVLHRGGWDPESTNSTLAQRICDERGISIDIMEKGDIYEIGGVKAEVIWPLVGMGDTLVSGGEEVNNMSIVIRFDYGEHSSLFTGDLYLSGEEMVQANTAPEVLDVDFLKVPHHAYLTSSGVSFLNAISPELAVSTGFLNIPAKLRTRYADCGIELLDDGTRGYIHVSADTTGAMEYETTRNDEAIDGGEVAPDEDAG